MFLTIFLIGVIGSIAMAVLGLGRIGGHAHGMGHGMGHSAGHSAGHFSGHSGANAAAHGAVHGAAHSAGHVGHSAPGHAHSGGPSSHGQSARADQGFKGDKADPGTMNSFTTQLLAFLSPFQLFVLCLGFGGAGLILPRTLGANLIWAAIASALILNFAIVKPLMAVLLRFASNPSDGLEGSVAGEAEALSSFDPQGRGLVRLMLDGQIVQLLAILESDERQRGVTVHKGDRVVILEVDASTNQCRVSRELAVA